MASLELPEEPGLRGLPVSHDGLGRDGQDLRCFGDGQAAKESQLDNLAHPRIERRQAAERTAEGDKVGLVRPAATAGRIAAMPAGSDDLTGLLRAWGGGDEAALHTLTPLVERELNRIASRCLAGERHSRSVSATALVNEAFLRLVDLRQMDWQDRAHFFAMSARLMRRVLVDLARARRADKRGGQTARVTIDEAVELAASRRAADVIRLDDALQALAAIDERKSRIVELRFFGGLSAQETAAALGISGKTVLRDWAFAKAWLHRELNDGERHDARTLAPGRGSLPCRTGAAP